MRKVIILTLLLSFALFTRAQVCYYRYWLDNDVSTQVHSVGALSEETTFTLDVSTLKNGIHTLHVQAWRGSSRMDMGPVYTRYFYVPQYSSSARTACYWFDNDLSTLHKGVPVSGMFDLDISKLRIGTHAVHYQAFSADGLASPVRTCYFYVDQIQIGLLTCQLWIDDDEPQNIELTDEDIVFDVTNRTIGMHTLYVRLVDPDGREVGVESLPFEVEEPKVKIVLSNVMALFSCDKDVDFRELPLKAYIATGYNSKTDNVMLSRVYDVPANTGLVLKGDPGTYYVPNRESYSYYMNFLMPVREDMILQQTVDGYSNYMLSDEKFVIVEDGETAPAGSAYLHVPAKVQAARVLSITFDEGDDDEGTTTGIISLRNKLQDNTLYDLQGRPVSEGSVKKGMYVRNGRKVILK